MPTEWLQPFPTSTAARHNNSTSIAPKSSPGVYHSFDCVMTFPRAKTLSVIDLPWWKSARSALSLASTTFNVHSVGHFIVSLNGRCTLLYTACSLNGASMKELIYSATHALMQTCLNNTHINQSHQQLGGNTRPAESFTCILWHYSSRVYS